MGNVEMHGRSFEDTLHRVIDDRQPRGMEQWLECVRWTEEAKNSTMRRGGRSPYQVALGRNPEVPGDLLQEGPDPVSSSASLHDGIAVHNDKVRQTALDEVLRYSDWHAARMALDARPRPPERVPARRRSGRVAPRKGHSEQARLGPLERARYHMWPCVRHLPGVYAWLRREVHTSAATHEHGGGEGGRQGAHRGS